MSMKESLLNDIKQAMRDRAQSKLDTLRLVAAAVKQVEVNERITVDDARFVIILDKLAKQRKESIEQFSKAERHDLVAKEQFELGIIEAYLPPPLSEAILDEMVAHAIQTTGASGMADMGKVMALLKPEIQGRCDMAKVSALIKEKL